MFLQEKWRTSALWGGVVILIFGSIFLLAQREQRLAQQQLSETTRAAQSIRADDHVRAGAENAIVVIEYSDFQCPACAHVRESLEKLLASYGDRVTFVYRHFPLEALHVHAHRAAMVAEAAARQGKFWEMHDLLFTQQTEWATKSDPQEAFNEYAEKIGLDRDTFQKDLADPAIRARVDRDKEEAKTLRIGGTPTIFVNGQETPLSELQKTLDRLIQKKI